VKTNEAEEIASLILAELRDAVAAADDGVVFDDEQIVYIEQALSDAAQEALNRRARDFEHLASAMKKMLPAPLLAEVLAHLDPLTPFLQFLRTLPAAAPAVREDPAEPIVTTRVKDSSSSSSEID